MEHLGQPASAPSVSMTSATEDAILTPPEPDKTNAPKLDMVSEWSATAEAYTVYFMEGPDGTASHFDMQVGHKPMVTSVAAFLKGKESPAVLDVAAAGGEPALSMAKEMPDVTVYGTDFAPGMVDKMRKRCDEAGVLNLKVSLEDGQVLSGFEDGSMDVVTCAWGLDSMFVYQTAIEQFHRVLKPGGMAIIAAWDKDPNSIVAKILQALSTLGHEMPKDIQPLGGDDGVKAMEEAGFTNVKKTQVIIPLHVPSSVGLGDLFSFMVKPTPINGILSFMEKNGYDNVRDEASTIFETQILKDIAEGCPPAGPGLDRPNKEEPAFYMNAVIVEGFRKDCA